MLMQTLGGQTKSIMVFSEVAYSENRASDMAAADWPSQTHVKNYRNFSSVTIGFFSVVEIPIKHSSLYIKEQ